MGCQSYGVAMGVWFAIYAEVPVNMVSVPWGLSSVH